MVATHNQQAPKDGLTLNLNSGAAAHHLTDDEISIGKSISTTLVVPCRIIAHNPKAGLNPLVDAASIIFTVIGKLRYLKSYRQLNKLQKELVQEINIFQENIKHLGYNTEYIIVCRYILCATIDDIISNTAWGGQGQWDVYFLLAEFNQDLQHHDKYFTILERAIAEPALYIDLMELMYICLSMGYKGQYRSTEHGQYQLEQIINNLYKHIRAYRGNISKTLSPTPVKSNQPLKVTTQYKTSPLFIFFVTACIIMTIFAGLGYIMDVISNEAYNKIAQIQYPISAEISS